MKRTPLYSSAHRPPRPADPPAARNDVPAAAVPSGAGAVRSSKAPGALRRFGARHQRPLLLLAGAAIALGAVFSERAMEPPRQRLTQNDIDRAVRHALEKKPLPSFATKAYEVVQRSVVHVRGENEAENADEGEPPASGGTGVVIVDDGIILTNLHVVYGAKRVTRALPRRLRIDGDLVSVHPENDLAVIKADKTRTICRRPRSRSGDLLPGDEVVAVGFPFGIGPSVSSGVVSGLNREFRSPEGERVLTHLIQFDAAANPGSSGGPLVTPQGDVVGIVTAILNPTGTAHLHRHRLRRHDRAAGAPSACLPSRERSNAQQQRRNGNSVNRATCRR